MTAALIDIFCRSLPAPPPAMTLDIDDSCERLHGYQQLSLFHSHYETRCFLPVLSTILRAAGRRRLRLGV